MYTFKDLVEITAKLRAEDGCPWDREQTFESLRKYMREEAEEAVQAVDKNDMENLCEELGDVLFQVMLNSQIAKEKGTVSVKDIQEKTTRMWQTSCFPATQRWATREPSHLLSVKMSSPRSIKNIWNSAGNLKNGSSDRISMTIVPSSTP